jgi:hypothetical protein
MGALIRLMSIATVAALGACQPESSTCILNLGVDITNVVVDAYNDTVRGASGSGSWTFNCNRGGTAAITGTVNSNVVAFDLTFNFQNCAHDELVLNGTMTDQTTGGGSSSSKIETATSAALTIGGTAIGCNADPIDATCEVSILYSNDDWVTEICGLTYP